MVRACPACQRPNAEAASKCLYCSEPLPVIDAAEESQASTTSSEALRASERSERHLVILLPGTDPSCAAAFARAADVDLYDARLHLQSPRPRLLRRVEGEEAARSLSERLSFARVGHYVVSEASVLSLPVSRARGGVVHERHLELTVDGIPRSLRFEDLLLLVRGEIVRERHVEKRLGTARGVSDRITPGLRLHLYERRASVAVEIDPDGFDWSEPSLASPSAAPSSLLHFEGLLRTLRERAPAAELDRGFDHEPLVLARSEAIEDVTEMLSERETRRVGSIHDNEGQFRFYARWRYRVARHLDERARVSGPSSRA